MIGQVDHVAVKVRQPHGRRLAANRWTLWLVVLIVLVIIKDDRRWR